MLYWINRLVDSHGNNAKSCAAPRLNSALCWWCLLVRAGAKWWLLLVVGGGGWCVAFAVGGCCWDVLLVVLASVDAVGGAC